MLFNVCDSKKVTIFWDKPESFTKGDVYRVLLNGEEIATCDKTHYTAAGLEPETEYTFYVELSGEGKEAEKIDEVTVKTIHERKRIDVTKAPYNAVGDGKTVNTAAIQKAIDDCGEGMCVYIPAGDFMTGSLRLHSNMELYLEKDAILHGTTNVEDYMPKIKSRFEGIEMMCYAALLNMGELDSKAGYNVNNIRISGEGTVCGGGYDLAVNVIEVERVLLKDYLEALGDKIKECENNDTIPGRARPRLINMSNAQDVVISGITIMSGPCWNVHMIYSDNIITHNCTFRSEGIWNGDGWDPDSSTNCSIFNCEFFTGDDAVAIKSGKNPEGNIINRPTEHIRVFDCISYFGHGVVIGSEMSGGVNDVKIWDCDLGDSTFGVQIKGTKKRGGYVRNVHVRDCRVSRVLMTSVPYNNDGEPAPTVPVFEDCLFEDLTILGVKYSRDGERIDCEAVKFTGFDVPGHSIKNVKLKNIVIDCGETRRHFFALTCCDGVSFENISVR